MNTIKLKDLKKLVGKKIEWKAPSDKANEPYGGVAEVINIDESKKRLIVSNNLKGDNLDLAFICEWSKSLCYSDSDRFVSYKIVD